MLHSDKIEPPNDHHTAVISDSSRKEMFETFQTWALQNYGDSGKTKTVTRRKYDRIVRILSGEEESNTENSKFRFWVKAKGFRLGPLNGESTGARDRILYVPVKHSNDTNFNETAKDYKRVAIVDDFFDIIYGVHVEMDGRGGKHAGQKRTYRAIAETYSFLPREAVTRFLMACSDCQKRMHLGAENHTKVEVNANDIVKGLNGSLIREQPPVIDFSVPITQTYLNHMRNKGYFTDDSFLDDDAFGPTDVNKTVGIRSTLNANGKPMSIVKPICVNVSPHQFNN